MKRTIITSLLIALFTIGASAQTDSVTVVIPAKVISSAAGKTLLIDSQNHRHFEVAATRNLSQGKEYEFALQFSTKDRNKIHCVGCTGVLPAKVIDYTITASQAKLDSAKMKKLLREKGYSKSPRYH